VVDIEVPKQMATISTSPTPYISYISKLATGDVSLNEIDGCYIRRSEMAVVFGDV
jgi:hypothetical protein